MARFSLKCTTHHDLKIDEQSANTKNQAYAIKTNHEANNIRHKVDIIDYGPTTFMGKLIERFYEFTGIKNK